VTSILDIDLLSAIFSFLAVALALFNKYSDEEIKATKKHAASIQQYIDASIFAPVIDTNISDWGDMPTKSDLADAVSKYGDKDTAAFVNWYSDYSSMNGESQVFYSQSENIRWDSTLHKEFKGFYVQHKIWNRRANGYLIPDWFYKLFRKKHQKKEDKIARTIQDLGK